MRLRDRSRQSHLSLHYANTNVARCANPSHCQFVDDRLGQLRVGIVQRHSSHLIGKGKDKILLHPSGN